jgi:hypothetical protein
MDKPLVREVVGVLEIVEPGHEADGLGGGALELVKDLTKLAFNAFPIYLGGKFDERMRHVDEGVEAHTEHGLLPAVDR